MTSERDHVALRPEQATIPPGHTWNRIPLIAGAIALLGAVACADGGGTLDRNRSDSHELPDTYVYDQEEPGPHRGRSVCRGRRARPALEGTPTGRRALHLGSARVDDDQRDRRDRGQTRTWRSLAPCV